MCMLWEGVKPETEWNGTNWDMCYPYNHPAIFKYNTFNINFIYHSLGKVHSWKFSCEKILC